MFKLNLIVKRLALSLALLVGCLQAQTTYHLHKDTSSTPGVHTLSTSTETNSAALYSGPSVVAGDYLSAGFVTAAGVPGVAGYIPAGTTITFSLWMRETKPVAGVYPKADLYLDNPAGAFICEANGSPTNGSRSLTQTATQYTLSCQVLSTVDIATSDVFYLSVGGTQYGNGIPSLAVEIDSDGGTDSTVTLQQLASAGPALTSVTPSTGAVGASVTISGSGFNSSQGNGTVYFNGAIATPASWGAGSITVPVPTGATTGNVTVVANGLTSNGVSFSVVPAPVITSLSPASTPPSGSMTINGNNFGATQGSGAVLVNNSAVTATSWSANAITFTAPSTQNNYSLTIQASGVSSNTVTLSVNPYPNITSLSPTSGGAGSVVQIIGTNLSTSQTGNAVNFGSVAATINSWTDNFISASVPSGVSGTVTVTAVVNGIAGSAQNFTVLATPSISNLSVSSGGPGTAVTINGSNFGSTQGNSTVSFNGTIATNISSWAAGAISTTVPTGASTGNVVVTVGGASSNGVSFTVPAAITSLAPNSGTVNTTANVAGSGFGATQGTSTIKFNGTAATPVSWSTGNIVVPVPAGASTGNVVVTVGGVASAGVPFTVNAAPSITNLSVTTGAPGPPATSVTISGSGFGSSQGSSVVSFNGAAAPVTSWLSSGNSITVTVPAEATTGPVTVTVNGQTSNGITFTVISTGTLTGSVKNGSTGITGATVQALQNGTVKFSGTTNSSGVYTISNVTSANYDVQASAGGFGTALQNATYVAEGGTTTTNFSLTIAGSITGKVTQSDGVTAIANATVQAFVGGAVFATATTNASGGYTISSLNAATYTVQASASSYVTQTSVGVVVNTGSATTVNYSLQNSGNEQITYSYDQMGRLAGVVDQSGDSAVYNYDSVGNLLAISRQAATKVAIISFAPTSGPVGTSVTITGSGFNSTPTQNTVKFNGTTATVASATPTQLVVTVPSGATTGTISETDSTGTATSTQTFTVSTGAGAPTITSISPSTGVAGNALAIAGTNFDIVANNRLTLNVQPLVINPATLTTQHIDTTVPAATGSGRVTLATPAGTATSTDFIIPFLSHVIGDIVSPSPRVSLPATPSSPAVTTPTITLTAGKIAEVLFDAQGGQSLSMQINSSTLSTCTLYLFAPNQAQLNVGGVSTHDCSTAGATFVDETVLPVTGTYVVGLYSSSSSGSLSLSLTNSTDIVSNIALNQTVTVPIVAPGQRGRLQFTGVTNQHVGISVISGLTSGTCNLALLGPDGSQVNQPTTNCASGSTAQFWDGYLPKNGNYTIVIDPQGTATGSVQLQLIDSTDATYNVTPIQPGAQPVSTTVNNTVLGQNDQITFSATPGQRFSVYVSNVSYSPSGNPMFSVTDPNGVTVLTKTVISSGTFIPPFTIPGTGSAANYTILIDPPGTSIGAGASPGTTFYLYLMPSDINVSLSPGVVNSEQIGTPGQKAVGTFTANPGQHYTVTINDVNNVVIPQVTVLNPYGNSASGISSTTFNSYSVFLNFPDPIQIPGLYTVSIVATGNTGAATGNIQVTLNNLPDKEYSVVPTSAPPMDYTTFTSITPGQNATVEFAVTGSSNLYTVHLTGNTFFQPGSYQSVSVALYDSNGNLLVPIKPSSNGSFDLQQVSLAAGNYKITVQPGGLATGSISVNVTTP